MNLSTIFTFASIAVAVVAIIYALLLHRQLRDFQERFKQFFGTKKSPHLNAIVMRNTETIKKMSSDIQKLYEATSNLHQVALRSVQKVGTVFYNPYGDTGGTMSFSIALLDAEGSGIVLSSLHARQGTRVYAKVIERGQSKQHLTGEEIEALRRADK